MKRPTEETQRQQVRQLLLTVFGSNATRDWYSTAHIQAVARRLFGRFAPGTPLLLTELEQCTFARSRPSEAGGLEWRFVNAETVKPARLATAPASPADELQE